MSYKALYRRWRPQNFEGLVGQEHITLILKNTLERGTYAHAYLFCGPRGTGKTSAAKIFAKAINCDEGAIREPCDKCPSCLAIQTGNVIDVVEIDAASNRGIDEMRDLREKIRYAPTQVRNKVYIIDEVHMLTAEAANALLKTLEEPPENVMFILATTEPHKLPATIVSRCQRLDFRLIGLPQIKARLEQVVSETGFSVTGEALQIIAEAAAGSMRDALSLLEQVLAYAGQEAGVEEVTEVLGIVDREFFHRFTDALQKSDLFNALRMVNEVCMSGKDMNHFTRQAVSYFRDLMVCLTCKGKAEAAGIDPSWSMRLAKQGEVLGIGRIAHVLSVLHGLLSEIRWSDYPLLMWELAIFRMYDLEGTSEKEALLRRVSEIERRLSLLEPESAVSETAACYDSTPQATAKPELEPELVYEQKVEETTGDASFLHNWPKVMEKVKKVSVKTHAMLLEGNPAGYDGKVLRLEFTANFHREMMEKDENKRCLQKVIHEMTGMKVSVSCCRSSEKSTEKNAAENEEDFSGTAADIFSGKIIDMTNESRR